MARQKKQPRQRVRASLFTKVLILVLLVMPTGILGRPEVEKV